MHAYLVTLAPTPNFISNIFYLTAAMSHYGILHTISTYNDLNRPLDDLQRHLDMVNGDGSWMGVSDYLDSVEKPKSSP